MISLERHKVEEFDRVLREEKARLSYWKQETVFRNAELQIKKYEHSVKVLENLKQFMSI